MARTAKIAQEKSKIERCFDNTNKHIFTLKDIHDIFFSQNRIWKLPVSITEKKFIDFLIQNSYLRIIKIQELERYSWRGEEASSLIYEIALSLKPRSYISHYSAMFLHNLTNQIPKTIYVTYERAHSLPKRNAALSQENIDNAFQKDERLSSKTYEYDGYRIVLISNAHAERIGISRYQFENGVSIPITNIERTLLDITVRQTYAGGILEIITAYKHALDTIQISKLKAYLIKMQYTYPYEQAVGFCMEYVGFPEKRIGLIEKICKYEFKFYLCRNIKTPSYSERWHLYYPNFLNNSQSLPKK
jgi:predicted transcriptional regulator of viral defense system